MNSIKQKQYAQIKKWLTNAAYKQQAIPAFNFDSWEIAQGIAQAAKEAEYPVFLMSTESAAKSMGIDYVLEIIRLLKVDNPWIISHWDHGFNYDLAIKAIDNNYDSVMYDGSLLDVQDNIEKSTKFTQYAKAKYVLCECEIGKIGGKEDDHHLKDQPLTDLIVGQIYNDKVQPDMLAAAVGTSHGFSQFPVNISFANIAKFKEICKPNFFVLHGGSGISEHDLAQTILNGVVKINIGTQLKKVTIDCMKDFVNIYPIEYNIKKLHKKIIAAVKDEALKIIRLCQNPKEYLK